MNKVFVVDEKMGRGKTSAAINYILNAGSDERFLIITPYKVEVARYKKACAEKHFEEPVWTNGSKLNGIKNLFRNGKNIVSTHALFQRFDEEVINLCKVFNYKLIMDEVANVVDHYSLTEDDRKILLDNNYIRIDEETKQMIWIDDSDTEYSGRFEDVRNLCKLGSLCCYGKETLIWLFPVEVFNVFSETYILTYKFNAQIQKYYYDYYNVEIFYKHVSGNSVSTYHFTDEEDKDAVRHDYRELVNILDNDKYNSIGEKRNNLSKTWYVQNSKTAVMKKLKSYTYNFFHNICQTNGRLNLWTTYKDFRHELSDKGYVRSFCSVNMRATNDYKDCVSVAYLVNIYLNPLVKQFFVDRGITVDEDGYALSEMLQFIWRSAIREYKPIQLYIPSSRMRNLLIQWIEENS